MILTPLNYSVIAEYVENEDQRRILHELGCKFEIFYEHADKWKIHRI